MPPSRSPLICYLRNRTFILLATPPIALFSLTRILANSRSGEPWLNWLAALVLWLFLWILALRRRLTLAQDWLEYTDFLTTTRVPWEQVTRLVSRRALGLWRVEGLEVWTGSPRLRHRFIELTQFSRSWRQEALGSTLRDQVPHLFQQPAVGSGSG